MDFSPRISRMGNPVSRQRHRKPADRGRISAVANATDGVRDRFRGLKPTATLLCRYATWPKRRNFAALSRCPRGRVTRRL